MYRYVKVPDHPYATKKGSVMLCRYVVEQYLGRYLKPEEVVRHIDSDTQNDRIENLIVFEDAKCHLRYHHKDYKRCCIVKRKNQKGTKKKTIRRDHDGEFGEYFGIILYGPNCKELKKRRLKMYAQRTAQELGIL